jgi:hypothetical protein
LDKATYRIVIIHQPRTDTIALGNKPVFVAIIPERRAHVFSCDVDGEQSKVVKAKNASASLRLCLFLIFYNNQASLTVVKSMYSPNNTIVQGNNLIDDLASHTE